MLPGVSPQFHCTVCNSPFDLPQKTLDKFPGWKPKYCQDHSPKKKSSGRKGGSSRGGRRSGEAREENLTLAQVLEKYTDGPTDGLFTDGSAVPNPGPGGWGLVWVEGGEIRGQAYGQESATTNNRMELQALIEAFRLLPEDAAVTVHTDSRLCVDTITKWALTWERNGWKKKGGEIKNLELVQELLQLRRSRPNCDLQWIAAHSGNRWNEYADSLATAWRRDEL